MLKYIYLSLFFFSVNLYSEEIINTNSCNPFCEIGDKIFILEDKEGKIETENMIQQSEKFLFKRSEMKRPNYGYTSSVYWAKFSVKNDSDESIFYIEIEYPPLDFVTLYQNNENEIIEKKLGDLIEFKHKEIKHQNHIFKLNVKKGHSATFFLKISSQGSVIFPINIWNVQEFHNHDHTLQLIYGVFFGIFVLMGLHSLFIFISTKELSYFYYFIYIIGITLFNLSMNGIQYQYLFPENPEISNILLPFSFGVSGLSIVLFTRTFLNTKKILPRTDKLLIALLIPSIFVLIGSFFLKYAFVIKFSSITLVVLCLILFITGIRALMQNYKPARFYVLGWSILIIGAFLNALRSLGILPVNFFSTHGVEVGSAFEVNLLSLALADKINIMKEENRKIQESALENQKKITNSFARFVPEQLLQFLGKNIITDVHLGDSVEKEMTVLFSDIRSFTTISEGMSPEENFGFINSYMAAMGPCIRKHNGFIDKYIGDAIMALFPEKPSNAIDASIEMLEELHQLNVKRKVKGFQPISIGIGIHTGNQMLGIIGEKERLEGTVISDVVNTASRLEGLTKAYFSSLLVSEDVLQKVEHPEKYFYRHLDTVKVKGKNQAVHILEILNGNSPRIIDLKMKLKPLFEEGIASYSAKNFEQAKNIFTKVLTEDPKDKASELYIERCNFYIKNGISPDWDGIEKLDFK